MGLQRLESMPERAELGRGSELCPGVPEQELGKQSREGAGIEEDSGVMGGTCPSLWSSVGSSTTSSWVTTALRSRGGYGSVGGEGLVS